MKKIFAFMMLFSSLVFAGGKLTIQPMYDKTTEKFLLPTVGFSVYQKMGDFAGYNGWIGTGESLLLKEEKQWFTMKHAVDFYVKQWTVTPGFQVAWDSDGFAKRHDLLFVKLSYNLW